MELQFMQNEQNTDRRKWIIVLVQSSDGVTGKTGETGKCYISKNGGTPAQSTNTVTEVDSINMPGHYYLGLTASELDTLGQISLYYKGASTLAFHDRALVSYNNPYQSVGGFLAGPGSQKGGISNIKQAEDLAKKVWEVQIQGKKTAKEVLLEKSVFDPAKDKVMMDIPDNADYFNKLEEKLESLQTEDRTEEILEAINGLPAPIDYTEFIAASTNKVIELEGAINNILPEVRTFADSVANFQNKLGDSDENISSVATSLTDIQSKCDEMVSTLETLSEKFDEEADMDKRFAKLQGQYKDEKFQELVDTVQNFQNDINAKMKKMMVDLVHAKYNPMINSVAQQQ